MSKPLEIAFYGDDFTGSTDAMEALALAGMRAVLFLGAPTPEKLAQYPGIQAVGVAGVSRSLPTEEMEAELRPVFEGLRRLNPKLFHYKMCSTFDSSPEIGSIGKAIEVGREVFGSTFTPLVVGAPVLGRYVVFGNLFARSGTESEVFRLDRHPTMRQHPITPMRESDLRLHLAEQTQLSTGLLDTAALEKGLSASANRLERLLQNGTEIILFDTVSEAHLPIIGTLLWEKAADAPPLYVVGSSGVEYALVAHWREQGILPDAPANTKPKEVEQIVAISGSCSPVTARQIEYAVAHGFVEIALNPARLLHTDSAKEALCSVAASAVDVLKQGKSVLLHTCKGPEDSRIRDVELQAHVSGSEAKRETGRRLGTISGVLLRRILETHPLPRVVVAGGDTSGYVARALGIEALEFVAPIAPGSPLCRISAASAALNGMEILFKGGQVGKISLFEDVRLGHA